MHTHSTQTINPLNVKSWNPSSPRRDLGDLTNLSNSIDTVGLIIPIVLDQDNNLIDGERRLTVFHLRNEPIPFVYRDELSESDRYELEIESNRHRKDFTWVEEVLKTGQLYRRKKGESAEVGEKFGMREAGRLLGVTFGYVSRLLCVEEAIRTGDKEISTAENVTSAINLLLKRTETEGQRQLVQNLTQQSPGLFTSPSFTIDLDAPDQPFSPVDLINQTNNQPLGDIEIPLSRILFNEDARDWMTRQPSECVDHILTDPPYGINPDNIDSINLDEIYDSHQVDENISLLNDLIPLWFKVLRPGGYCVFCYDLDHHNSLQSSAKEVGFKVQRWPLSFCKTSMASNKAAGFNFTKNVEHAMVLRKGLATLAKTQPSCWAQFDFATERKIYDNPFCKPFELWKWLIEAVSIPGQTILDTSAGGGSCPRALVNCGRNPLGIEKDPNQFPKLVQMMKTTYNTITNNRAVYV